MVEVPNGNHACTQDISELNIMLYRDMYLPFESGIRKGLWQNVYGNLLNPESVLSGDTAAR